MQTFIVSYIEAEQYAFEKGLSFTLKTYMIQDINNFSFSTKTLTTLLEIVSEIKKAFIPLSKSPLIRRVRRYKDR